MVDPNITYQVFPVPPNKPEKKSRNPPLAFTVFYRGPCQHREGSHLSTRFAEGGSAPEFKGSPRWARTTQVKWYPLSWEFNGASELLKQRANESAGVQESPPRDNSGALTKWPLGGRGCREEGLGKPPKRWNNICWGMLSFHLNHSGGTHGTRIDRETCHCANGWLIYFYCHIVNGTAVFCRG